MASAPYLREGEGDDELFALRAFEDDHRVGHVHPRDWLLVVANISPVLCLRRNARALLHAHIAKRGEPRIDFARADFEKADKETINERCRAMFCANLVSWRSVRMQTPHIVLAEVAIIMAQLINMCEAAIFQFIAAFSRNRVARTSEVNVATVVQIRSGFARFAPEIARQVQAAAAQSRASFKDTDDTVAHSGGRAAKLPEPARAVGIARANAPTFDALLDQLEDVPLTRPIEDDSDELSDATTRDSDADHAGAFGTPSEAFGFSASFARRCF